MVYDIHGLAVGLLAAFSLGVSADDAKTWIMAIIPLALIIGWLTRTLLKFRDERRDVLAKMGNLEDLEDELRELRQWRERHENQGRERHEQLIGRLDDISGRTRSLEDSVADDDGIGEAR